MPTPEAPEVDPSHFLPSEVAQRGAPRGRPPIGNGQPTAALQYKVRALTRMVEGLDTVKVSGATEGPLINRLLQAALDEADSDATEPDIRQKIHASVIDAVVRLHELQAKTAANCLDLETKRSDTRLKRQMWKDKTGIGKTRNTTAEPSSLADVAALMRSKDPK